MSSTYEFCRAHNSAHNGHTRADLWTHLVKDDIVDPTCWDIFTPCSSRLTTRGSSVVWLHSGNSGDYRQNYSQIVVLTTFCATLYPFLSQSRCFRRQLEFLHKEGAVKLENQGCSLRIYVHGKCIL